MRLGSPQDIVNRFRGLKPLDCDRDYHGQEDAIGLRYRYHYGYRLTAEHPLVRALDEVRMTLAEAGISTLFYITPVNMGEIKRLGGEQLYERVQSNVALLSEVAAEKKWNLIDLSGAVEPEDFIDLVYAGEHVNHTGRRLIGERIARELKTIAHPTNISHAGK
jgi:hypothetical protein